MRTKKKSQSWSLDFAIGLVLFLLASVLSIKLLVNTTGEDIYRDLYDEAKFISNQLRSEGYPVNWTNNSYIRVGLLSDNRFDEGKYGNFTWFGYKKSKSNINTKFDYYFYFEDQHNNILNITGRCGFGDSDVKMLPSPNNAAYYYTGPNVMQGFMETGMAVPETTYYQTLDSLFANITDYNFIFMENPMLDSYTTSTENQTIEILENWTREGNTLFLTQNVNINKSMFHVNFSKAISDQANNGNVSSTNYFNFTTTELIDFSQKKTFTLINPDNYEEIVRYHDTKSPAVATWTFGNGRVFYIADLNLSAIYDGEISLEKWVQQLIPKYAYAHCGEINISSIDLDEQNLAKIVRIFPKDSNMLKMHLFLWTD